MTEDEIKELNDAVQRERRTARPIARLLGRPASDDHEPLPDGLWARLHEALLMFAVAVTTDGRAAVWRITKETCVGHLHGAIGRRRGVTPGALVRSRPQWKNRPAPGVRDCKYPTRERCVFLLGDGDDDGHYDAECVVCGHNTTLFANTIEPLPKAEAAWLHMGGKVGT